jgi:hypothetical protein
LRDGKQPPSLGGKGLISNGLELIECQSGRRSWIRHTPFRETCMPGLCTFDTIWAQKYRFLQPRFDSRVVAEKLSRLRGIGRPASMWEKLTYPSTNRGIAFSIFFMLWRSSRLYRCDKINAGWGFQQCGIYFDSGRT